jgi:dTDP-4-amino-4,6-dideoxygalactose transaminase
MTVPFLDLKAAYEELEHDIESAVLGVLRSGQYIGGSEVDAFEDEFSRYIGSPHCITVGNGLDALRICLLAMGVGPGDEVVVPSNTFIATWLAVSQCGAVPIPVEPDRTTYNLNPERVKSVLTARTKVIIPVHLYGQPADMDPILGIGRSYGIFIIEDAAQAHGSKYKGRMVGALSDAAAWSFYPGKNLGACGDAGAITTSNGELAKRMRMIRNYGSSKKYVHEIQGLNSRLDPIQAAILRIKLAHLDEWNDRRRVIACKYQSMLVNLPIELPHVPAWAEPVWHLFVIRTKLRDALRQHLIRAGIDTQIHYPTPPYSQSAYVHFNYKPASPDIDVQLSSEILSLPIGPHLKEKDSDSVVAAISDFFETL